MKGTKYLSELVDSNLFQKDKLNIIKAPTGSGKTYFALQYIPSLLDDALHHVVYLIDTINGKEQILQNYNAIPDSRDWIGSVGKDGIWFLPEDREKNKQVVVITYAKFGYIQSKELDFYNKFDYIICDELHNLPKFQCFSTMPNNHSIAKTGIESAVKNNKTVVIALSATPNPIIKEFKVPCNEIPVNQEELRQYEVLNTKEYVQLNDVIEELDPCETGVCYVSRITFMSEVEKIARKNGFSPIPIWSIKNTDHPMTEEQLSVRESILKDYTIPPQYNFLIINGSAETSIKIKSPVDYVIVHSTNQDTQVQVRGRVNRDLKSLYLRSDGTPVVSIPEEFLNCRLFAEDKRRLSEILNVRNPANNRIYQWSGLQDIMIDNGYEIIHHRSNNRHYAIIMTIPFRFATRHKRNMKPECCNEILKNLC